MWIYTKQLEYPVNITNPDPRMAKLLMALLPTKPMPFMQIKVQFCLAVMPH